MTDTQVWTPKNVRRFDDHLLHPLARPDHSYLMTPEGWKKVRRPSEVGSMFIGSTPSAAAAKPLVEAARKQQVESLQAAAKAGRKIHDDIAEYVRRKNLGAIGRWWEDLWGKRSA